MFPPHHDQKNRKIFITAKTGTPLKQLLKDHLPQIHDTGNIISAGGVWMESKRVFDPHFIINPGETVKVYFSSTQGKTYFLPKQDIIFEDPDFMVVYKPVDLNVHSVPSSFYNNLTFGVNVYLQQQGINFTTTPITRLDRPVEGLVIFAKNKESERRLFHYVKARRIQKWYTAALEHPEQKENPPFLRIRDMIANDGNKTQLDEKGKKADTLFYKKEVMGNADIYSVFIFTGRRHQIRFHSAHYLSPIIGDLFYDSSFALKPDEIALICRGYNIPYKKGTLKVRLSEDYLQRFCKRVSKARKVV